MYDRASLQTCLTETFCYLYHMNAAWSMDTLCLPRLPSLAMYACMPAPMCLALCTATCVLCIFVHYSHYYFLGMLSLLLFAAHIPCTPACSLYSAYMAQESVTHLQWWTRVWRSCIGFCTDISWCVKCSKSHCLGFLTAVKTVLFLVLLDLKVSWAWRSQHFPKDQTHLDSELEL